MNSLGLKLLKSFESCRLTAYKDAVGVWTLGWGSTGEGVSSGVVWTQAQADDRLAVDVAAFESGVRKLLKRSATDDQLSAMTCFVYNLGLGALKSSTLLNCFNKGNVAAAAVEFSKWNKAGGKVLQGLVTRRKAESLLFEGNEAGVLAILAAR